ncbi:MAG TPA: type IV pilin protein [Rhodanobacteraceae bacterium]|nr:type IV pilin protein [Rhodanobacteraceae bacterium]
MATRNPRQPRHGAIVRIARGRGFTLIELMIVVAIIAVLAALAYPSYINYITKTRRNAASACLSEYANYMERYYTTNLRYDQDTGGTANDLTKVTLDCAAASQTGPYYLYRFNPAVSQASYKIVAIPQGAQASRDTRCGTLAINQSGQRFYLTSKSDAAGVTACWK